ncbi:unnamed protein product, partial [Sphacelaria rigidula]
SPSLKYSLTRGNSVTRAFMPITEAGRLLFATSVEPTERSIESCGHTGGLTPKRRQEQSRFVEGTLDAQRLASEQEDLSHVVARKARLAWVRETCRIRNPVKTWGQCM